MNPYVNYDRRAFLRLAVVVAQLVEQSLLIPEVRSSNPVIGNLFTVNCIEKTKIKKKEVGYGPFKKYILPKKFLNSGELLSFGF